MQMPTIRRDCEDIGSEPNVDLLSCRPALTIEHCDQTARNIGTESVVAQDEKESATR